jgi:membrane-associated protease RseP (regulator of RpoE activity)
MAEYLGVPAGLMVKQVAKKSEAATAGLRAFDVILKVGVDSIATSADWDRALRSNQGKPVQVTILRDKKQETLTLQVDSKRHQGEVEFEDLFPSNGEMIVAQADLSDLGANPAQELSAQAQAETAAARRQAEQLREQVQKQFGANPLGPGSVSADELQKQTERLRESLESGTLSNSFQLNSQQMEQLRQQMEELRKSFNPKDFKIDPKQMEQLQELWKDWRDQDWRDQDWQDQDWQGKECGHFV